MKPLASLLYLFLAALLPGCALPVQGYYGLPVAQAEANRQYTENIERHDQDARNSAQMSAAKAAEVATRHAPSSVSTTQVFAPTFSEQ